MKLFLRLFWLLITESIRSRCQLTGPVTTALRVYPNDLDVNGHVNNGVYLTYADLGRTDLMLRSGAFKPILKNGWYPVVIAETIRFKRSLKLFQRFDIKTSVVGWNERDFFLQQQFYRNGTLYAGAAIKARFLSRKGGSVAVDDVLEAVGFDQTRPSLPEWVSDWDRSVEKMENSTSLAP